MSNGIDVLFASIDEPGAAANLRRLIERIPQNSNLIHVENVKGFSNVLLSARDRLLRDHFFLVDADAHVLDTFSFSVPDESATYTCCIFKAFNPVNDLAYGHGGIKVYDRRAVFSFLDGNEGPPQLSDSLEVLNFLDFPSGGSRFFLSQIANVHQFNISPEMTWRAAFRESAKLRYLTRLKAFSAERDEIEDWLHAWMRRGTERPFGSSSLHGAKCGNEFGQYANPSDILLVNDYGFLGETYDAHFGR